MGILQPLLKISLAVHVLYAYRKFWSELRSFFQGLVHATLRCLPPQLARHCGAAAGVVRRLACRLAGCVQRFL